MKKSFLVLALLFLVMSVPVSYDAAATDGSLLFELTEAEVDSFLATMETAEGHTYLRRAWNNGRPELTKAEGGGIHVSNRDADWQSVDIRHEWMEPGMTYKIVVEFASEVPTAFKITNTDAPYGVVLAGSEDNVTSAVVEYEMSQINSESDGQRGVRLTTHPHTVTIDYIIRNIQIYEGVSSGDDAPRGWPTDIPSLYQTYSDFFPIGNILEPQQLDNEELIQMYLSQYNAVTAENAMKPAGVAPSRDVRNYDNIDRLVDWAVANNIEMHGHTLVWHSQSAPWLTTDSSGNPLTRAEAQENMRDFITDYAGRYVGKVASWDVLNEVFNDSVSAGAEWRNVLRTNSPWYLAYSNGMDEAAGEAPEDFIYDAFVFTRLAAPDALLFYNDFNEESPGKRNAIATMVEDINERWLEDDRNDDPNRLLIEVIGMQSHFWTDYLNPEDVRDTIERFIETGAMVAVTELDIPIGRYGSFGQNTEEQLQKQAELYRSLFEIYAEYANYIVRVSFWGKADHQSWRSEGHPLLFDRNMQPKSAFDAVIELASMLTAPEPRPENPAGTDNTGIENANADDTASPAATPGQFTVPEPDFPWWAIAVFGVVLIGCAALILILRKKWQR